MSCPGNRCIFAIFLVGTLCVAGKAGGQQDEKADRVLRNFAKIEANHAKVKQELGRLVRVKLQVRPSLVLLGEEVSLQIDARADTKPNPRFELIENCCNVVPKSTTAALDWQEGPAKGTFSAAWKWKPRRCGNYLLRWKCDIGGDIPEFSRPVGVIDNSYAVAILNSTSHIKPRPEPDFHELHLPFSYWWEPSLCADYASAESFAIMSRYPRQFGDDPSLLVFTAGEYSPGDKTMFYDESESLRETVLKCYVKLGEMCEMPQKVSSLLTYGIGNGPAKTARRLGYDQIGALCANQNWRDGDAKINHWGMPARPYFMAEDDFRKAGARRPQTVIGIQQCGRHTIGCRDYNCVYSLEPATTFWLDRHAGAWTRVRTVNERTCSRELDWLPCYTQSAGLTDTPFFFCVGFEMNGVVPDCAPANRLYMEYLARQSRNTKLVFASASAVVDFFKQHYDHTPESVLYQVDPYVGITQGGKPACCPDTMEIENDRFMAVMLKGQTLPNIQYDYTKPWNYPDWGNEGIPRAASGYPIPNTPDRFRVTPLMLDTRPFKATVTTSSTADETTLEITIDAAVAQPALALGVWDIPREYSKDASRWKLSGAQRFIPVRAPYTGNLCGILVAGIQEGKNIIRLAVSGPRRPPKCIDLDLGGNLRAKVFQRDTTATAYLYNVGTKAELLTLVLPEGFSARRIPCETDEPVTIRKKVAIPIEPNKCQRLFDVTYDQLMTFCPGAKPASQ
jgi:hypothetical protein